MKFAHSWIASYLPGPAPDPKVARRAPDSGRLHRRGCRTLGRGHGLRRRDHGEPAGRDEPPRPRSRGSPGARRDLSRSPRSVPLSGRATRPPTCARAFTSRSRSSARDIPRASSRESAWARRAAPSRTRLLSIGAGTISAPVDATNHVLWDIGQPLHAFDLDTLAKGVDGFPTIIVRRARAGETLVTLDGVDANAHPPAPRDRGRREARRSRGCHGRARDGDLGEDDARPSRGSAFRPARGAEDGAFSRHAHGRLAPLRAGNRSRGDA